MNSAGGEGSNGATDSIIPPPGAGELIAGRYECTVEIFSIDTRRTFLGLDHGTSTGRPLPVRIELEAEPAETLRWRKSILDAVRVLSLPRLLAETQIDTFRLHVMEIPIGRPLVEAWHDPRVTVRERFGWLIELVEACRALHQNGAFLPTISLRQLLVSATGQLLISDLSELLPFPVSAELRLIESPMLPPELIYEPSCADARVTLFTVGAVLYGLYLKRDLEECDLRTPGRPIPFAERFPDVHPYLARLIDKAMCHDPRLRFAGIGAGDETGGLHDLIAALEACRDSLDQVRLDFGCWTSTGMVRGTNEDSFAVVYSADARLESLEENALVILADGMGGMESGEVASALAVQVMRQFLLQQPPFTNLLAGGSSGVRSQAGSRLLSGTSPKKSEAIDHSTTPTPILRFASVWRRVPPDRGTTHLEQSRDRIIAAMREANRQVFWAATHGLGTFGMGCTAEVVQIDRRQVLLGHIGDSRTYILREGTLRLLTRDHTLVQRLVELGQITAEEAKTHPRRSELQQAIGGRLEIEPDFLHFFWQPGDTLLICSDGLSETLKTDEIVRVLQEAPNADRAARRLVNLANAAGATDNVSVVVVRASEDFPVLPNESDAPGPL